jgi:hypothetical protein
MKKLYVKLAPCILLLAFLTRPAVNTYSQSFDLEDKVINVGVGFGYAWGLVSGASSWPAISVSFEKGFRELSDIGIVSLGGIVGFQHASVDDLNWNDFAIGARGALHFTTLGIDNVDVYGGASLGLRFYSSPELVGIWPNWEWESKTSVGPFFGLFGGGRYYFTDKIAAFAELGYDIAWFKLGISAKL